jgi:hypothetical protein
MVRDAVAPWAEEVLATAEDLMALSDERGHHILSSLPRLHSLLPSVSPHGMPPNGKDTRGSPQIW